VIATLPTEPLGRRGCYSTASASQIVARSQSAHRGRQKRTFATLALAARVPFKVVSEMLGHKSVKLTLDTYAHTLPGMHESAVEALEAAF